LGIVKLVSIPDPGQIDINPTPDEGRNLFTTQLDQPTRFFLSAAALSAFAIEDQNRSLSDSPR
jgi:hypothetical protein